MESERDSFVNATVEGVHVFHGGQDVDLGKGEGIGGLAVTEEVVGGGRGKYWWMRGGLGEGER